MEIITKTGGRYLAELRPNVVCPSWTTLWVRKLGRDSEFVKAHGLFLDRLPYYADTVRYQRDKDGALLGFNAKGKRTFRIFPEKVLKGMVLVNPNGFRSTEIVKVIQ